MVKFELVKGGLKCVRMSWENLDFQITAGRGELDRGV